MIDKGQRYEMRHVADGYLHKRYDTFRGAKIAIAYFARKYRSFGYRAVDRETGETWGWDPDSWSLKRMDNTTNGQPAEHSRQTS